MIVLRRANGDIIWFDAVTEYGQTYSASVTKHPVATGGYVSDHTTTDNVVLQISAVLSDADFNLQRSLIEVKSVDGMSLARDKQFTNNTQVAFPVEIVEKTTINRILPEVVAQFTKDTIPEAYVTPQDKVKTALAVKLDMISMWKHREEFQILDIIDNTVVEEFSPCIFTNLQFREDEATGDGVFPNMTIEQVVFTDLREVAVKIKTANKGRKSGTTTKKKETEVPPDNAPQSNTKKDASAATKAANNANNTGS